MNSKEDQKKNTESISHKIELSSDLLEGDEEVIVLVPDKIAILETWSNSTEEDVFQTTDLDVKSDRGLNLKNFSFKMEWVIPLVVTLVVAAALLSKSSEKEAWIDPSVEKARIERAKNELALIDNETAAMNDLAQIELCLKGYLSAESISDKLKFSRHPEEVEVLMDDYYENHEMTALSYQSLSNWVPLVLDDVSFFYIKVKVSTGEAKNVLLERLEDGGYKADWESDVCYLPMAWGDFLEKGSDESLSMRVMIKVAHLYLGEFSDDEKYHCYRLRTRHSNESVYAYVEQDSKTGLALSEMINKAESSGDKNPQAVILGLSLVKGAKQNVVKIDRFIAPRWTYVNETR